MITIPPPNELAFSSFSNLILLDTQLNLGTIGILLVCIALLIICSALFSGSEVAFFSLQHDQIGVLKSRTDKKANAVIQLLKKPKYLLSTLLIANNLVNIGIIIFSTFLINHSMHFYHLPIWLTFLIEVVMITAVLLLLGEIAPKVYATNNNEKVVLMMGLPLLLIRKAFYPLNLILVSSGKALEKRISSGDKNVSIDDLNQAIDLAIDRGEDNIEKKKILKGLVKFGNINVKQIMCNRMDVTAIDNKTAFNKIIETIKSCGFSRIPVFEESFDNIKGILYTKDLLVHSGSYNDLDWQSLLRKPLFVPENKKISSLLKDFQLKKVHLAIVVDEYGGTSGVVTLEDILEEIVGDIKDEFDAEDLDFVQMNENEYIFEGKTSLSDFSNFLHLDPDFFDDIPEAESLAGLILELEGHIPKFKSIINYKHFTFTVESVSKKSIKRIRVMIKNDTTE